MADALRKPQKRFGVDVAGFMCSRSTLAAPSHTGAQCLTYEYGHEETGGIRHGAACQWQTHVLPKVRHHSLEVPNVRVPCSADNVTATWLTKALTASGALPEGAVAEAVVEDQSSLDEMRFRIEADYDGPVPLDLPRFFMLRCSHPQPSLFQAQWIREETAFYRRVAPRAHADTASHPIPRIFGTGYEIDTRRGYILGPDLEQTHRPVSGPLPPTLSFLRQAVDSLAALHAYWWEHPDLGELTELPNQREEHSYNGQLIDMLPGLLDMVSQFAPRSYRDLVRQAMDDRAALMPRILSGHGWSVRHSAPLAQEFVTPINARTHTVLLARWATWAVHVPAHDICYLLAGSLATQERRSHEMYLVRRYWQHLCMYGVKDYSWQQCWLDYRLFAASAVCGPVWRWAVGRPMHAWWPLLVRTLDAYADLRPDRPVIHAVSQDNAPRAL